MGGEDPLEAGMATHPSILAWRVPWTEEPGGLIGSQRVRHDGVTKHPCTIVMQDVATGGNCAKDIQGSCELLLTTACESGIISMLKAFLKKNLQ